MNKHGVDKTYFKRELEMVAVGLDNYTPQELERVLRALSHAAEPVDKCKKCKTPTLNIYSDNLNVCRTCWKTQAIKGR